MYNSKRNPHSLAACVNYSSIKYQKQKLKVTGSKSTRNLSLSRSKGTCVKQYNNTTTNNTNKANWTSRHINLLLSLLHFKVESVGFVCGRAVPKHTRKLVDCWVSIPESQIPTFWGASWAQPKSKSIWTEVTSLVWKFEEQKVQIVELKMSGVKVKSCQKNKYSSKVQISEKSM